MAVVSGKIVKKGDIVAFHSGGVDQLGRVASCDIHTDFLILKPSTAYGFHGPILKEQKFHHIRDYECWLEGSQPQTRDEEIEAELYKRYRRLQTKLPIHIDYEYIDELFGQLKVYKPVDAQDEDASDVFDSICIEIEYNLDSIEDEISTVIIK